MNEPTVDFVVIPSKFIPLGRGFRRRRIDPREAREAPLPALHGLEWWRALLVPLLGLLLIPPQLAPWLDKVEATDRSSAPAFVTFSSAFRSR
jgi:hypothetical protein